MIRHCALFRWNDDATPEQIRALADGLGRLPAEIAEIEAYTFGSDLGLREGNWDFAVVADFSDADAFARYVAHPAHQALIADLIVPIRADRLAIQFEVEAG